MTLLPLEPPPIDTGSFFWGLFLFGVVESCVWRGSGDVFNDAAAFVLLAPRDGRFWLLMTSSPELVGVAICFFEPPEVRLPDEAGFLTAWRVTFAGAASFLVEPPDVLFFWLADGVIANTAASAPAPPATFSVSFSCRAPEARSMLRNEVSDPPLNRCLWLVGVSGAVGSCCVVGVGGEVFRVV